MYKQRRKLETTWKTTIEAMNKLTKHKYDVFTYFLRNIFKNNYTKRIKNKILNIKFIFKINLKYVWNILGFSIDIYFIKYKKNYF